MNGKGSAARPLSVDTKTFAERWEATFRPTTQQADEEDDILVYNGLEEALIGTVYRCGMEGPCAVYDYELLVDVFTQRDGMTYEEAVEYIDFNIVGLFIGARTPFILERRALGDEEE